MGAGRLMAESLNDDNLKLIRLLEKEMAEDLASIDFHDESQIDIKIVYQWYLEAEKLIRVLSNILTIPMTQAINQLRYAGHHALKSEIVTGSEKKQNIIESYKHCKRAVYDSLDFYVYKLSEGYRALLPLMNPEDGARIEALLKSHIKEIYVCRVEASKRIEYYSGIQKTLIGGLDLIEEINIILRDKESS